MRKSSLYVRTVRTLRRSRVVGAEVVGFLGVINEAGRLLLEIVRKFHELFIEILVAEIIIVLLVALIEILKNLLR